MSLLPTRNGISHQEAPVPGNSTSTSFPLPSQIADVPGAEG
jgi:hypothetical protein